MFVYLKTLGTNLKYNFEDIGSSSLRELLNHNNNPLILFGKDYDKNNIEELRVVMVEVAWFSYWKSLSYLLASNEKAFTTDANWGCTIRVAQMHLFHLIF